MFAQRQSFPSQRCKRFLPERKRFLFVVSTKKLVVVFLSASHNFQRRTATPIPLSSHAMALYGGHYLVVNGGLAPSGSVSSASFGINFGFNSEFEPFSLILFVHVCLSDDMSITSLPSSPPLYSHSIIRYGAPPLSFPTSSPAQPPPIHPDPPTHLETADIAGLPAK